MSKYLNYIGLGLVLAKIRFDVSIERQQNGHTFRCNRRIRFLNLSEKQQAMIGLWAEEYDLPLVTIRFKDIQNWISALSAYRDLIDNQRGLKRMEYVIEHPIPTSKHGKTWDDFIVWVKGWDDFNTMMI